MATPFVEETAKKEETVIAYNEEDDDHDSKERVLQKYFLQEWELIKSLIDDIVTNQHVSDLHSVHKIRSIMDKYQEQGQLIEPYLDSMVSPLMFTIRIKTIKLGLGSDEVMETLKPICIIIYSLITVCGYKAVMKFFPHHVSDLELALSLLEKCHNRESATSLREESTGEMEAKCVLLLWLSILVLVPFDISSVDTSMAHNDDLGESELAPLVLKMVGFCKDYLSNAGPMRSIAGLLLSKLLTRPDMLKAFTRFIHWTHDVLSFSKDDVMKHFQLLGVVEALAAIFKAGGRKLLYDIVPTMWNDISSLSKSGTAARSPLLRKCLVKLTQRIGLICLPHRSPSWRYVSKIHSLGENVSDAAARKLENQDFDSVASDGYSECFQDEDMDVPEIIEEIIEMLLAGLRDTDTVVRWSAAKGIGRITFRLTSALSEEVLSSVLELFSPGEGDGSWHGGCLALAELARRGLLLPNSLPKVVLVVVKALHCDVRRGPHSVGSHIRDAAAYVCWAFGRTYYYADMRNVLDQLAPHLLKVACYDREVNCRRASAAAFQENVGRQGNYPHGIDIVNTADYFSLSSRVNSYLHIAVSVAQYEGYLHSFAEELLFSKIRHWDKSLRELAAEALSALVKYDPEYFSEFVLEKLIPCTLSSDLCTRHGATLAAAELVLALHHCNFTLSSDKQKRITNIVPAIEKARLCWGKGGEIMRLAVSRFIECVALSNVFLPDKTRKSLLDTLNENLRHPNSQIQDSAVKALKHLMIAYLVGVDHGGVSDIALNYSEMLGDPNVAVRRGSALALGALPYHFLANRWRDVIIKLSRACLIEDNPEDRDAEARVNAVKGVISVCETLTLSRDHPETLGLVDEMSLYMLIKDEVMTSLLRALDDYSVDNRGDVGSWVREAAMNGLERCSIILCSKSRSSAVGSISGSRIDVGENSQSELFYDVNLATSMIGGISKQAVEKLDKLREAAALVLQRILYNEQTFVPFIPHREKLEEIVPNSKDLNWGVPTFSFPRFVKLLWLSCYSRYVLSGLVISIGGLQDSLRKSSTSALMEYLEDSKSEDQEERRSKERVLSADLIWVLENYRKCDRVITPTLKTIEILFSKKILLDMEVHASTFLHGLLDSLTIELKGLKDFSKLYAGIAILGYIASSSEPISIRAFSYLLTLLGHRYPKIRKASAEQVYLVLLQNVDLLPVEKMEKAFEVILETCWEGDIEEAKQQKSQLFGMAGLEVGSLKISNEVSKSKSIGETKKVTEDENATYSSLVESSGF